MNFSSNQKTFETSKSSVELIHFYGLIYTGQHTFMEKEHFLGLCLSKVHGCLKTIIFPYENNVT